MADVSHSHPNDQVPSSDRDAELCAIVERFETAWNEAGGQLPEIEHFLPRGDDDLRGAALAELILIDLEWRRAAVEQRRKRRPTTHWRQMATRLARNRTGR